MLSWALLPAYLWSWDFAFLISPPLEGLLELGEAFSQHPVFFRDCSQVAATLMRSC